MGRISSVTLKAVSPYVLTREADFPRQGVRSPLVLQLPLIVRTTVESNIYTEVLPGAKPCPKCILSSFSSRQPCKWTLRLSSFYSQGN